MEFNAVIFCGNGHNLIPLTAPGEYRTSKALLPVANKPLIEYVLEWCDQAPFRSVNIVTDVLNEHQIAKTLEQYQNRRDADLKNSSPIKLFTSELKTTGGILSEIFPHKSEENYVILPCDFITDVPPQVFIEVYRGNSDENIGLSIFYSNRFENIDKKVLKSNYTVYSTQDNGNMVLLDMYSKNFVMIDKFLKIRTQLLWKYPSTSVSSKLLDSFIFFMNSKCWKDGNIEIDNRSVDKIKRDLARDSWKHSKNKETIGMFALDKNALFARVDNLAVYMEMNRHFLKLHARSNRSGNSSVGADCIVGDDIVIGEKSTVKRSVVGKNVTLGKKCRVSGCILLEGVTVGDGVVLENCILGRGVSVGNQSKLVNCHIEGGYIVNRGTDLKGETLRNMTLGEISDGDVFYESTDESDDSSGESEYDDEGFEEEEYDDDIFAR